MTTTTESQHLEQEELLSDQKALQQRERRAKHHIVDSSQWTAFRRAEKRFKSKSLPQAYLQDVLDLRALVETEGELTRIFKCKGRKDAAPVREVKILSKASRGFTLLQMPGFVMLPGFVSDRQQRELVKACLTDYCRLNETNLHAHYDIPVSGLWDLHASGDCTGLLQPRCRNLSADSLAAHDPDEIGPRKLIENEEGSPENYSRLRANDKPPPAPSVHVKPITATELLPRLRWANLGHRYHWGSKSYDFSLPTPSIPTELQSLCKSVIAAIEWCDVWNGLDIMDGWDGGVPDWMHWSDEYSESSLYIAPDAGIVNFYQLRDTLMGHVDRSEISSTSPLVSISLGRPAIFLLGGSTRDEDPVPILLRSGDVLVMSGPCCRRAFHGIPRVLDGDISPPHLTDPSEGYHKLGSYIADSRININVRQVFPRGFKIPQSSGTRDSMLHHR